MSKPKREQFRAKPKPCAYCGGPSSTRDHVIPELMFTVLDQHMITVRACERCNQDKRIYETYLGHYFSIDIRTNRHPVAQQLFWGPVMRAVHRKQSPMHEVVNKHARPTELVTHAGLYAGRAYIAPLSDATVDKALGYIVRGLTYYQFGEMVSPHAIIEVRPLGPDDAARAWRTLRAGGAKGPFKMGDAVCIWGFHADHANHANWLISFYGAAMCYFVSVEPPPAELVSAVVLNGEIGDE